MNSLLEKRKSKLDEEKKRLQQKEKILLEQAKKNKNKRFFDIGRMAAKANIDHIDPELLLGAFLEISNRLNDKSSLESWKNKAAEYSKNNSENGVPALTIKFKSELTSEALKILKDFKFRYHRFTKEYYGKANAYQLQEALKGLNFEIKEISP